MCFRKQAHSPWTFHIQHPSQPIELALKQLGDDLNHVLDAKLTSQSQPDEATLLLQCDSALQQPESWQIQITENQIRLSYADDLGAVYGIYHISEHLLGFDPLWFWKQVLPTKQDALTVEEQTIHSSKPVFQYRGWFLNDEDLLVLWHTDGGYRKLDYPHYQHVTSPYVIQRACEALLRTGGNLIIPASFVNVMNPDEARMVSVAVAHGLYVTQHHIEPLGVSAFSFETYWEERGQKYVFEYARNPKPLLQTWRDYAQKWWELAGEQVVWQLGLRGRGDRPIWDYDKTITEQMAGQYISKAMHDQWDIVRSVDSRPTPPATTTLWHEGAQLMANGQLHIPDTVTVIFSDKGQTQCMQADFHNLPRDPNRTYGAYYHVGFWIHGTHLVQGTSLSKMQREVSTIIDKGDTHYAIVNTANIREHVLPLQAFAQLVTTGKGWCHEIFTKQSIPSELIPLYNRYFEAFITLPDERSIQDGYLWVISKNIAYHLMGKIERPTQPCDWPYGTTDQLIELMYKSAQQLDSIVDEFPMMDQLPADERLFYEHNLREQARMFGTMHRIAACMIKAMDDQTLLGNAVELIEKLLADRQVMAQGVWKNWYRGESKECWRQLLADIQNLVLRCPADKIPTY
jgi:hypothetical protein